MRFLPVRYHGEPALLVALAPDDLLRLLEQAAVYQHPDIAIIVMLDAEDIGIDGVTDVFDADKL